MTTTPKPPPFDEVTLPAEEQPDADVRAWQARKIKAGLKDADAGRFASPDAVKKVVQKFIRNG